MDFNDLPADVQLLQLNIQEKLMEMLRETGPIKATGKVPDRLMDKMVKAVAEAQNQTVNDVGGIQFSTDPATRMLTVFVPRVAGWFVPEE